MPKLKSSVIMATYNGKKFLEKQLDSLRKQTRIPNEVLIMDDCSTDGTYEYIKDYIYKYQLNWKLLINKKNCGWEETFYQLIQQCDSDVIFYSDQDDIWDTNKIFEMMKIVEDNENILCLASKFDAIDGEERKVDIRKIYAFQNMVSGNTKTLKKIEFSSTFMKDFFPGCVLCFRKEISILMKKIGEKNNLPDRQICRIANLYDGLYIYDNSMIKHRFHNDNAGGNIKQLNGNSTLEKRVKEITKDYEWLHGLLKLEPELSGKKYKILYREFENQRCRMEYLKKDSAINFYDVIKGTNIKKDAFADLFYKYNMNRVAGRLYYILKSLRIGC